VRRPPPTWTSSFSRDCATGTGRLGSCLGVDSMTADNPLHAAVTTTISGYRRLGELTDATLIEKVELARDLCGGSIGLFALLDEHQRWFRHVVGVSTATAAPLLPLCALALTADEPICFPDLRRDPRLASEPAVVGADGLVALGTVRVRDEAGQPLGVLAVGAQTPLPFDARDRAVLARVARSLAGTHVVRRDLARLHERHRQHLEALELREGLLRAASRFAVVAFDLAGVVRFYSAGAERLLGWHAREVIGRMQPSAFRAAAAWSEGRSAPPGPTSLDDLVGRAREGGTDEREVELRRKDGTTFPALVVTSATRDEDGGLTGYVAIAQDITERRAADQMKSDFIAIVSHELRTPLTSIRGALGLLGRECRGSAPKVSQLLTIASENAERLVRLVNDILDLHKIEAGRMEHEARPTSLDAVIAEAIGANQPYATSFGVELRRAPLDPAVMASLDRDQIVRVLTNLISNAVKASPKGAMVEVRARLIAGRVRVEVVDRGAGVPESFRPHVFGKFMQADPKGGSRKHPGTGLGLSIVRAIVLQHGGEVGFESEPGAGATFWFELPLMERST
jgi:PAS domain S-box-containing protein